MQDDATVRRVLLASLHQAIGEVLPARLGFYERWLNPSGPDVTLGVASFMAMLTFLHQEGEAFELISSRAGHLAAVRSFQELPSLKRAYLRLLPRRARARKAIGLLAQILPSLYPETRVDTTRRRSTVFVGVDGSPFCAVRGSADPPSCSFYSSTITTFLQLLNLGPSVRVSRCRSTGVKSCLLVVLPDQARSVAAAESALGLADELMIPPSFEIGPAVPAPELEPVGSEPNPFIEQAAADAQISEAGDISGGSAIPASPSIVGEPTAAADVPVPDAAPIPETAPTVEAGPTSDVAPALEIDPPSDATPTSDTAPAAEVAQVAGVAPPADVAPNVETASPGAVATTDTPAVEARLDAIFAKRTRAPKSVRLNFDALFAKPNAGQEDPEGPWHRL